MSPSCLLSVLRAYGTQCTTGVPCNGSGNGSPSESFLHSNFGIAPLASHNTRNTLLDAEKGPYSESLTDSVQDRADAEVSWTLGRVVDSGGARAPPTSRAPWAPPSERGFR